jgi:hypothetical protein
VGADLPVTTRDAEAVASILRDPGRCAYPPDHVLLLTETGASRDGIVTALRALAKEVAPDDALTVYYSGHGVAAGNDQYFLLTHGADHTKLDDTALNGREFTELLLAIPARRLLLLLDCCRAGGIFDRGIGKAPDSMRPDIPVDWQQMLSRGSGTVVIASSQADEVSLIQGAYSVFTYVLVEAFCGVGAARRDGFVYTTDLALHTRERVPGLTGDSQHPTMTFRSADDYRVAFYAAGGTTPKGVPDELLPPSAGAARPATADPQKVLSKIRELLADLPLEFREVQLMVADMGIRNQTIHYDSGSQVYWNEILKAADVRRGMERVFEVLDPRLGENPDWSELKAAYRAVRPPRTAKDQSTSSAKVLPFVRAEKRGAGTDSAPSLSGDQIQLTESLRAQAEDLLSDIDQLAYAESEARFRTTAIPVHLRIAEINRILSRLSDGTSEDESMDFPVLNAVAVIREKLEFIQALLDGRQARRQAYRVADAGRAIVDTAGDLVRALYDQTAH